MPGTAIRPDGNPQGRPLATFPTPVGRQGLQPHGRALSSLAATIADRVEDCLVAEVLLTPKPGLVDAANTGSHRDMDVPMFVRSAAAIRPFFARLLVTGVETADLPACDVLAQLRPDGLAAERAMLAATAGVNTHKGAIFAFGLLAAACGRVWARDGAIAREAALDEVAAIAQGLVARELAPPHEARTAGERLYRLHGLTGARGEAESGYAIVRDGALPVYEAALRDGFDEETALHVAFLYLLEHNADTNLVARGGLAGLAFAQREAARLNALGGVAAAGWRAALRRLDAAFIDNNLSPGGSADLLALTLFLSRLHAYCGGKVSLADPARECRRDSDRERPRQRADCRPPYNQRAPRDPAENP